MIMDALELITKVIDRNSSIIRFGPEDWETRNATEVIIIEMIQIAHDATWPEASAMYAEMIERMYP